MAKPYGIIYKAEYHHPDGKIRIYIGQTKDTLKSRINGHKKYTFGRNGKSYFSNAIRKYGWDVWRWSIICKCLNQEELNIQEERWRKYYDENLFYKALNLRQGGNGKVVSQEERRKMSERQKGKKQSAETRLKNSISHKGKRPYLMTDAIRRKISIANKLTYSKNLIKIWNKGRHLTDKEKLDLSNKLKGRKLTEEHKTNISKSQIGISRGIGRKLTEEHRANISKGVKNSELNQLTLKRNHDARRGRPLSDEHKNKLRISMNKYYESRTRNA